MWSQRLLGAEFMWMVGLSCLGALGCGLPPLLPRFPMLMMMPSIFKRKDATKLPQEIHLSHNELTTGCLEVLIVMWCNVNGIQKWRNAHFFNIFFDIFQVKVSVDFDGKLAVWSFLREALITVLEAWNSRSLAECLMEPSRKCCGRSSNWRIFVGWIENNN